MNKVLVVVAMLAGCASDGADPAVAECRGTAARSCEAIGYGGNETCLLVFAQGCSPEDEASANAACCAANDIPVGSECRLKWR